MIRGYIYGTTNCAGCKMTEKLADNPKWTTHDVTNDDQLRERLRSQGYQQFPVVEVFGRNGLLDSWSGFRPERINFWNPRVDA